MQFSQIKINAYRFMNYFLMLSIILFISSCEKEVYKITVKGRIIDATTGEPLNNVNVKLTYNTEALLGFTTHIIGSAETDKNGDYEIKFRPLKESRRYYFEVEKENYVNTQSAYIEYNNSEDEKQFEGSFALFPEAVLEIHFQNISPFDENDNLNCQLIFTKSGKPGIMLRAFTGTNVNKLESQVIPGNQTVIINWSVRKNSMIKYYSDSIFCKPFQTSQFDIKY